MVAIFDVFAEPKEALKLIQAKPTILSALSMCTGALFLVVWLGGCWGDLKQGLEWTNLLGPALISPLVVGFVSLGTTALLYLLIFTLSDHNTHPGRFKTLYSLNLHCGAIFLLGEVVNLLLVRTDILGDRTTPLRGRFPLGLDTFLLGVDDPNIYLSIILHSTSVFLIWYLVVLSMGVQLISGTAKPRAAFIVIAFWSTLVLLALGAAYVAGGDTVIRIRL